MELQKHELAEQDYIHGMKYKDIAAKHDVSINTVKSWKQRHKWNRKGVHTKPEKGCTQKIDSAAKKDQVAQEVKQVIENPKLNEKQRLFCLHYVKCFNATKAYQKAYECDYKVAMVSGPRLLGNVGVKDEIQELKQSRLNREMLSEHDIFQKYMDIAFSDITDYVTFGREEVPVMGAFGPVEVEDPETGEKTPLTKEVNTVKFLESGEVDGSLIQEVSQGKDGVKIKSVDRMRALNWLADHVELATPEQVARVEHLKVQTEKLRGGEQTTTEDKVTKLFEAIGGVLDGAK